MVVWRRWCICAPSEGEWEMRESASPSEGVEGLVERETRLYGGLAAMAHLRTFGRCGRSGGDGNAATGVLRAVPHLRTFGR